MRATRGMGGMLYSGECRQTFRGMGNVLKHSRECLPTSRGISSNIPGNVAKHSGECRQTFRGMSSNIPGDVAKHSGLAEHSGLTKHSGECCQTFRGMSYLL